MLKIEARQGLVMKMPFVRPSSSLLLLGLSLAACSAGGRSSATIASTFLCADDRSFTVKRDSKSAIVHYLDAHYHLSRRPSSIGYKYGSGEATLVIDGDYAAFVTEAIPDLEDCRIKPAIAA